MPTLVSQSACNLTLLPLNALNQVPAGYQPSYSQFTMTDNTSANYPITGIAWNGTTGQGVMSFTCPAVSTHVTRNLSIALNGTAIIANPNPITIDLVPPYHGRSVLTNAILAWDCYTPDAITPQFYDYSGNGNYAVDQGTRGSGFIQQPSFNATTSYIYATGLTSTTGYPCLSTTWYGTNNLNTALAPVLNTNSMATTYLGCPFQTITTTILLNTAASGASEEWNGFVWGFTFKDSLGNSHSLGLWAQWYPSAWGMVLVNGASPSPANWVSLPNIASGLVNSQAGTAIDPNEGLLAVITVTISPTGAGELWCDGTRVASGFNIYTGFTVPSPTGASTLTFFGGCGFTGGSNSGSEGAVTTGQLELIAYSDIKSGQFIYTNASAWNVVGTSTGPVLLA